MRRSNKTNHNNERYFEYRSEEHDRRRAVAKIKEQSPVCNGHISSTGAGVRARGTLALAPLKFRLIAMSSPASHAAFSRRELICVLILVKSSVGACFLCVGVVSMAPSVPCHRVSDDMTWRGLLHDSRRIISFILIVFANVPCAQALYGELVGSVESRGAPRPSLATSPPRRHANGTTYRRIYIFKMKLFSQRELLVDFIEVVLPREHPSCQGGGEGRED